METVPNCAPTPSDPWIHAGRFSQSVITTLLARSTRPTHTLYSSLLSSVRRESLHHLLSSGRLHDGLLSSAPLLFTYLLVGADLVERADLGEEPEREKPWEKPSPTF